jgi:drug/metabolite transporter (DMT)-like permease
MNNLRGALLMIVSMGLFAIEDMLIKLVSLQIPVGQVLLILALGGTVAFAVAASARRQTLFPRELLQPTLLLRNSAELVATCCFVLALSLIPISTASAILQATPLAVTMCAALFLGETVGWRRWMAIGVGFLGVLLIVRPGLGGFQPASLLAVVAVLALALRDVATRLIPPNLSTAQVSLWAYVMIIPAGLVLLTLSDGLQPIAAREAGFLLAAIFIGVAAYSLIVMALRSSDLSAIAPFRYSRLLFAMAIGLTVFGERPDAFTVAGAALVIASGLYALARERALFSEARQG